MASNVRFDTSAAIWATLDYFDWHFVLAAAIALAAALLGLVRVSATPPPSRRRAFLEDLANKLAFSLFGLATAYFLSLGMNPEEGANTNSLLAQFGPPVVGLVTGGVVYLGTKGQAGIDRTATGIATFLLTCALSYQAFSIQLGG